MRKAGEEVTPELYQNIWKHLKSDGIPDQAANQMAAEMITHDDFEGSVEKYQQYEACLTLLGCQRRFDGGRVKGEMVKAYPDRVIDRISDGWQHRV
mgnify:CR=1 FL=1